MKILIVSKCHTHPTNQGNSAGILKQCALFQQLGHEVHFLYIDEQPLHKNPAPWREALRQTREWWGDKFHCFHVNKLDKLRISGTKFFRLIFCNRRLGVDDNYPIGLTRWVEKLQRQYNFDVCVINYYELSRLFKHISIPKLAIFTHDIYAYKRLKTDTKMYDMTASAEAKAMQRCPHIFAVQDIEADYFQVIAPHSKVYSIYGRFKHVPAPVAGNHNILFLSSDNQYNIHGIRWFVSDILPQILKRWPDAKLLAGGMICKAVPELANTPGVECVGFVENPEEFYLRGDVAINPISKGTGLKIKTFDSMARDKVTIVHPHSLEGVYRPDQIPVYASDKPEDWVAYLEKVWGDDPAVILDVKKRNHDYLKSMDEFVISEYKRFLAD